MAQHLRTLQISTFGSDGQDGIALGIRSFPVHKLVMICFDSDKNKAEEFSKRIRGVLGLPTTINLVTKENVIRDTMERVNEILNLNAKEFQQVLMNISSGDKLLGCAALSSAFINGIKAFGMDSTHTIPLLMPVLKLSYTIVNHPAIKWEGGSLKIKQDKNITDDTPYMEGQVLTIDTSKMTVTFVAHRGWGPDGKTIYYIVTDATPEMPANMMGVPFVQADELIATTPVAVDLLQFGEGIRGSGPMGFQSGIGAANPDDTNYSPMWKISFIEWKDPSKARILENMHDVAAMQAAGLITVLPAMGGKHVVNCPFFEPSTVFEHQGKLSSG